MNNKNLLTARDIHGPYVQLLTNLQGENGQEWLVALNRLLRKENPWPTETLSVPLTVWKTIVLGIYDDVQHLRREFARLSYHACYTADQLFDTPMFILASKPTEVDLVKLSVKELGFKGYATYADVCARAATFGLELCPAEVGPALRLVYNEQTKDDELIIAMRPIIDGNSPHIFYVKNDDCGLLLLWRGGNPRYTWSPEHRFVFVLPRK